MINKTKTEKQRSIFFIIDQNGTKTEIIVANCSYYIGMVLFLVKSHRSFLKPWKSKLSNKKLFLLFFIKSL